MKQSNRAVLASATQAGAQAGQVGFRTHYRCTIDVSTSARNRGIRSPKSSISFPAKLLNVQNDETPVGSAFRGLLEEIVPGTAEWSAPQLNRIGLTHQDFQGARGCITGIHGCPCADLQRRALPRAKAD
jgi:hypothetical protein